MDCQTITAELQMYLLSRTTEVPQKFTNRDFVKGLICNYLKIKIDDLKSEQRTTIYNTMHLKLRRFREYHPNEKSAKVFKSWLGKQVHQAIASVTNADVKTEDETLNSENETEWQVVDEVSGTSSNEGNDVNKAGASSEVPNEKVKELPADKTSPSVEIPTKPTNDRKNIKNEKQKEVNPDPVKDVTTKKIDWNDFKIPKKTERVSPTKPKDVASHESQESSKKIGDRRASLDINKAVKSIKTRRSTLAEPGSSNKANNTTNLMKEKDIAPNKPAELKSIENRPKIVARRRLTVDVYRPKSHSATSKEQEAVQEPIVQAPVVSDAPVVRTKSDKSKGRRKPGPKNRRRHRKSSHTSVSEVETSDNFASDNESSSMVTAEDFELSASEQEVVTSPTIAEPKTKQISTTEKRTWFDAANFVDSSFSNENCLTLESSSAKVCDYFFELNPESKIVSFSKGSSVETTTRSVFELKELLYWPGVGVQIELPELTIQRYCQYNPKRELIGQHKTSIEPEDLKFNNETVLHYYGSKADRDLSELQERVELSHDMIRTYLEIMMKCVSVTNYVKSHEIELILRTLLDDVNKISRSFQDVPYSYYLNDHKYFRDFEQDVELSSNTELLKMREVYNPEIVFNITRCQFKEFGKVDIDHLRNYFNAILKANDPDAIEEFNAMLGRGYTLYCVGCQQSKLPTGQFKNAKRIAYMSEHIGPFCVNEFNCVKCEFSSDVLGLVKDGWRHHCEEHLLEE